MNNINISMEKKKKSTFWSILLIFVIIVIGIIGALMARNYSIDIENTGEDDEYAIIIENNVQIYDEKPKEDDNISKEALKVYEKFESAKWVSKEVSDNNYIYIENGKLKFNTLSVKFIYGTPKYIVSILKDENLVNFYVITEDGNVYFADISGNLANSNDFEKIDFEDKIIDAFIADFDSVYIKEPYFLTASGKLLNVDGNSYEDINRNHIAYVADNEDNIIYINDDYSLEGKRTESIFDYISVAYKDGANVIISSIFTSEDKYYVITKKDKMLEFSYSGMLVADYYNQKSKLTVKDVKYTEEDKTVNILFDNNTYVTIYNVEYYYAIK